MHLTPLMFTILTIPLYLWLRFRYNTVMNDYLTQYKLTSLPLRQAYRARNYARQGEVLNEEGYFWNITKAQRLEEFCGFVDDKFAYALPSCEGYYETNQQFLNFYKCLTDPKTQEFCLGYLYSTVKKQEFGATVDCEILDF